MITYKSYLGGSVQSLGFFVGKVYHTVGVIEPGSPEFKTEQHEEIQVMIGDLVDLRDGKHYGPGHKLPPFAPLSKVCVSCTDVVVYVCRYSNTPFR
ncbi:hypothetical protein A2738_01300 [Candidatus Nomurabacteria bacterium RIFCSPHIGHO2_01_FULL_42_15]|uniref:Uncharacterized protein n=1 Tax=Candidatus Nomurabacteria bacterium RIFCSPHIGHO2_01_FULL_42_15 TaxID=1801742 RepID=A0A1F6VFT2_9BACT|nr:MAG: hypothetical protein A2738_01300 [Candidatus Nomurabacteria bacterium RIFCSPHIGHO2_01_FULL_42_15]OGI93072.1 MAG: hypothetical protein A3A99_00870 [Candidatus Nomurabacteria bacterium RIFCSPLOWO2_01_FULL_41_18]